VCRRKQTEARQRREAEKHVDDAVLLSSHYDAAAAAAADVDDVDVDVDDAANDNDNDDDDEKKEMVSKVIKNKIQGKYGTEEVKPPKECG